MLSTCLFQTSFSCGSKTWTTNRRLSLIRFYRMPETDRRLSPIFLHRYIRRFGTRASERCLVPTTVVRIRPVNYCTSFRQRERNVFRQINVRQQRLRSLPPPLHMLTHRFNLLSNPVSPGVCPSLNIRYPERNPLPCMEEMQRNPHINRHARTGFRMAYSRLSDMFPFLMECKITTFSSNEQIILAKS